MLDSTAGHHRPDRGGEPDRELLPGADDYIAKPYTPHRIFEAPSRPCAGPTRPSGPVQVNIFFDHSDDGEILRRLGQFRSLVFARTTMNLEAVKQLGRVIKEIWCMADEWAHGCPGDRITTLTYTITAERLVLEFRDAAGWLGRVPISPKTRPVR